MKIFSICLATLFFLLTVTALYEVFEIPKEWSSPLVPESIVKAMQQAYIIHTIVSFVFFCPALYIAIKRQRLAKFGLLAAISMLYIVTLLVISFIRVNG